jgi:hypothetical protein
MKKSSIYFLCASLTLVMAAMACNMPPLGGTSSTQQPTETKSFEPQNLVSPTKNSVFLPQIRSGGSITATPGQAGPAIAVDEARVDLSASTDTLRVGETVTLMAKPVGIGLPYYYLNARDEGVQNADPMVQVTYDNHMTPGNGSSQVLEFVSAVGEMTKAEFVLRAKAPGLTTLTVTATGEIQLKQEGNPYVWSGAGSGSIVITVNP